MERSIIGSPMDAIGDSSSRRLSSGEREEGGKEEGSRQQKVTSSLDTENEEKRQKYLDKRPFFKDYIKLGLLTKVPNFPNISILFELHNIAIGSETEYSDSGMVEIFSPNLRLTSQNCR